MVQKSSKSFPYPFLPQFCSSEETTLNSFSSSGSFSNWALSLYTILIIAFNLLIVGYTCWLQAHTHSFFFLSYLRIAWLYPALLLLNISMCIFKNKYILLCNHNIVIKFRKLYIMLLSNLQSIAIFINCLNNDFYKIFFPLCYRIQYRITCCIFGDNVSLVCSC